MESQDTTGQTFVNVIVQPEQFPTKYRLIILICNLLVLVNGDLMLISFGRLLPELLREFPEHTTAIFWGGSLSIGLPLLLAYPALVVYRRIGFVMLCCCSMIILTIGILLFVLINNGFMVIVGFGILGGLGSALLRNALAYKTDKMFPYEDKYHVLTTGLVAMAYPLTFTFGSPLTEHLVTLYAWRYTISGYLGMYFLLAIIGVCITYKYRYRKYGNQSSSYIELVGMKTLKETNLSSTTDIIQSQTSEGTIKEASNEGGIHLHSCGCDRYTATIMTIWAITSFLMIPCISYIYAIIIKHAAILGYDTQKGTNLQIITSVSDVIISVIVLLAGDRFIKGKCLIAYIIILPPIILMNVLVVQWTAYWQLVLFCVVSGATEGMYFILLYPVCSELLDKALVKELFAIALFSMGMGTIVTLVTSGYIFDATDSFKNIFYMNTALLSTTLLLFIFLYLYKKFHRIQLSV